jgi:hypothetical protein
MNMAPIELQSLLGPKRVQALLGRTPPVEIIFKSIEMTVRRFFPDDYSRIMVQMQNAQLSPKEHIKLVKNKGKLAVWILTKSGLQGVRNYTPQVFDMSPIQEQVDEEENARIEEMSMGASLVLPSPFEDERHGGGTAEDSQGAVNEATLDTSAGGAEYDQLHSDLDPLDPMATILSRSLKSGCKVVVARAKLLDQFMLNSFEVVNYDQDEVPSNLSPAAEVNYPIEEIDFSYSGVQSNEAVKILMSKVITPWCEKYYPEAAHR